VVTYTAIVLLNNPEGKLRPGLTASVSVETARVSQKTAVRNSALRFEPLPPPANGPSPAAPSSPPNVKQPSTTEVGRSKVYQVEGDAIDPRLSVRWIEIGVSDGVYTEVKSGLRPGDSVVVDEKARDQKRGFRLF
jgi:HlyD family secretion protein